MITPGARAKTVRVKLFFRTLGQCELPPGLASALFGTVYVYEKQLEVL